MYVSAINNTHFETNQSSFKGKDPHISKIAKGLGYDIPEVVEPIIKNGKTIGEKVTKGIKNLKDIYIYAFDKDGNRVLKSSAVLEYSDRRGSTLTSTIFHDDGSIELFTDNVISPRFDKVI